MLDSNITTLLATLLGGGLSLVGSFLANRYQYKKDSDFEKRKELRDIIEELYGCVTSVYQSASLITYDKSNLDTEYIKIRTKLDRILLLVELYLPSFKLKRQDFTEKINDFIGVLEVYKVDEVDLQTVIFHVAENSQIYYSFVEQIALLAKEKGYSYY